MSTDRSTSMAVGFLGGAFLGASFAGWWGAIAVGILGLIAGWKARLPYDP